MEAHQIVHRSKAYTVLGEELYKLSLSGVSQRCISPEEGMQILHEIHSGTCGHHASPRASSLRHFDPLFWVTAHADIVEIIQSCIGCQYYAKRSHLTASELKTIPIAWPFIVWGLDM